MSLIALLETLKVNKIENRRFVFQIKFIKFKYKEKL